MKPIKARDSRTGHPQDLMAVQIQQLGDSLPADNATMFSDVTPCGRRRSARISINYNITIYRVLFIGRRPCAAEVDDQFKSNSRNLHLQVTGRRRFLRF
jgi:hypothetical protein